MQAQENFHLLLQLTQLKGPGQFTPLSQEAVKTYVTKVCSQIPREKRRKGKIVISDQIYHGQDDRGGTYGHGLVSTPRLRLSVACPPLLALPTLKGVRLSLLLLRAERVVEILLLDGFVCRFSLR